MKVRTNNVPRPLIDACELTPKEREEFDYLDWRKIDAGLDSATFFHYRGEVHFLGNFMRVEPGGDLAAAGWHGYHGDSFSTGTVVRLVDDENVVVGYAISS
jgi:hypothetical protein